MKTVSLPPLTHNFFLKNLRVCGFCIYLWTLRKTVLRCSGVKFHLLCGGLSGGRMTLEVYKFNILENPQNDSWQDVLRMYRFNFVAPPTRTQIAKHSTCPSLVQVSSRLLRTSWLSSLDQWETSKADNWPIRGQETEGGLCSRRALHDTLTECHFPFRETIYKSFSRNLRIHNCPEAKTHCNWIVCWQIPSAFWPYSMKL